MSPPLRSTQDLAKAIASVVQVRQTDRGKNRPTADVQRLGAPGGSIRHAPDNNNKDDRMNTQAEKAAAFAALHQRSGAFVVGNPWDRGAARILEHLGFEALATTGAGYAFSRGTTDLAIATRGMLPHFADLCAATDLPVTADLQNGYGDRPEEVAACIRDAAQTGLVGGSIEDLSGKAETPLFDIGHARERIVAAAEAARALPFKFMLTARAESLVVGTPDLGATIARLQAYQEAGADVLFAPGLRSLADIQTVIAAIDRPLNVIIGFAGVQLTVPALAAIGVKRISVGGSLARAAYGALLRAGRELLTDGTCTYVDEAVSGAELSAIMRR